MYESADSDHNKRTPTQNLAQDQRLTHCPNIQKEKEELDDVTMELELADDDDKVP